MIMCVLLCYPVSIHVSQLLSTGRPISSLYAVYFLEGTRFLLQCVRLSEHPTLL